MKTAIYARVSTGHQDSDNQVLRLREFAAAAGHQVVAEYTDQESGKTAQRAQFKRLFAAAARREFDLVLFWSLDRFSREGVLETLQHLQRLTSYGVNWRSYTEQYLDSCGVFRDAVLSILATIAKQERVRLSERTIAGLQRARAQGRRIGRPAAIVDRQQLEIWRVEGISLAEAARRAGVSARTIGRRLSLSGLASTAPRTPSPAAPPA
jgi:DNA invertase Pin-like site-specific DNA recombinase